MKRLSIVTLAVLLLSIVSARAEETPLDPLLRLLITKGVITEEEARSLQDEAAAAPAETPAPAPPATAPAPAPAELPKGLKGLSVGTLTYISYQDGTNAGGDLSRFTVKRGYLDIRKTVAPFLDARITPDVHQDESGDFKVRLKYLYAKFNWERWGLLHDPHFEVGIAHMPWLDFEEHINRFRMQDTMYLERVGLFNSADVGVMFGADLGAPLPEEYRSRVNDHYAGRWGSFQVGVYDGGGYHASERNSNKVVEGRFTLRPLPDALPGLQVSLLGLSGKGNVADTPTTDPPDWDLAAGMVSYESPRLVLTGQYSSGSGNQKGSMVDSTGKALDHEGYSLFAEVRVDRDRRWSLIGRYDHFDPSTDDPDADVTDRSIVGVAWQFIKGNYLVLDYDRLEHDDPAVDTEDRLQLTLQLKY